MSDRLRSTRAAWRPAPDGGGHGATPAPDGHGEGDAVDTWVRSLESMLRLPAGRRRAICDELSQHLRQRTGELVLSGRPEADAVRQAINELGEAAELARQLDKANRTPGRRRAMNVIAFGIGGAVIAIGTLTLTSGHVPVRTSVFQPPPAPAPAPPAATEARLTLPQDCSFRGLVAEIHRAAGIGVLVDWLELEGVGIVPDGTLGISGDGVPLMVVLERLAERSLNYGEHIDWRFGEAHLELAPRGTFDRRERTLASYDIRRILDLGIEAAEISDVLTTFVSPDDWADNGGDLATLMIVGDRMFVEAPPRMHVKAQWILGELTAGGEPVASAGAAVGPAR